MRPIHLRGLTLGTVASAAAFGVAAGPSAADPTTTTTTTSSSTITVVGNGQVEVTPDLASLDVDVARSASTSRAALSAANARVSAVVKGIERAGVPAHGIQTSSITTGHATHKVGPKGHQHTVRVYTADETLSVNMKAPQAGAVIDAATREGANGVSDLNFSFSNPDAGATGANAAAIASARQQADAAAAAVGYVVTGVQSIDLDPGESTAPQTTGGTSDAAAPVSTKAAAPTNVNPGQQQVTASVQVIYTIAPATS